MFDLRKWINDTMDEWMREGYKSARVREYATEWFGRGVLVEEDLMRIEAMLKARDETPAEEFSTAGSSLVMPDATAAN